ncbi:hypothetical protein [Arthrobacter castelli]|uniref:hypothetical protein n=1 Tax=Arthrobacter castelli TaxID=271431 RepID=UPI00042483D3|nr:hypothetical protein [Arthrobacter castelli]
MHIYLMVDKGTGEILGMHHAVDPEGRSTRVSEEEALDGLPPGVERNQVCVLGADVDAVPSSREATFDVDLRNRTVTVRRLQQGQSTAAEA